MLRLSCLFLLLGFEQASVPGSEFLPWGCLSPSSLESVLLSVTSLEDLRAIKVGVVMVVAVVRVVVVVVVEMMAVVPLSTFSACVLVAVADLGFGGVVDTC